MSEALDFRRFALSLGEAMSTADVSAVELADVLRVDPRSVRRWMRGAPIATHHQRALTKIFEGLGVVLCLAQERPMAEIFTLNPQEPDMMTLPPIVLDDEVLKHFGFSRDPFDDLSEDRSQIWMTPEHRRTESAMELVARRGQILAIAGDPGSGKSTRLRRFLSRFITDGKDVRIIAPASLARERMTGTALSVAIIRDLVHRDTSSWSMEARSNLLRTTLEEMGQQGVRPVMLIDEAHLLPDKAFIAVKQLWDSFLLYRQLGVILTGQLPLAERLRTNPELKEVTARTYIVQVPVLKPEDVRDYLEWRFSRAGRKADEIVSPEVYKLLSVQGKYPLGVNNLVMRMLDAAATVGDTKLTMIHLGRS